MAIHVKEGHSQGPQTGGVRLLGGCVYYAEYGTYNVGTQVGRQAKTSLALEMGFLWTSSGLQ